MSDISLEQRNALDGIYKSLLKNFIIVSVGWIMMWFSMAFLRMNMFFLLVGALIVAAPVMIKFFQCRSITGLFKMPEYEVITITKDGYGNERSRTSDGGYQARMGNLFLILLVAWILFMIASILSPIMVLVKAIRYGIACKKLKVKQVFTKSASLFLIAIPVLYLVLPILAFGKLMLVDVGQALSEQQANIVSMQDVKIGDILIVNVRHTTLFEYFDFENNKRSVEVTGYPDRGDKLIVISDTKGNNYENNETFVNVRTENGKYQGKEGWVRISEVKKQ